MPARLPPDGPPVLAPAEAGQAKSKSAAAAWQELAADLSEDLADRLAASWTGRWQALRHVCGIPATSWQGGWSGSAVWLPPGPFPWVPSGDLPAAGQKPPRHGLRGSGLALACLWLACPAPDLACGQASIKDAFAVLAPFFTRIFLQPAPCPRPGERLCPARNSRPRHAKAPFRRADSRRRKGAEGESGSSESPEAVPRRWTGAPKGTERTRPLCRS